MYFLVKLYIYGQAYHLMLKTAMVFLKSSGEDWQLAAIPKSQVSNVEIIGLTIFLNAMASGGLYSLIYITIHSP